VEVHGWGSDDWNGPATVVRVDDWMVSVRPDSGLHYSQVGAFAREHIRPLVEEAGEASQSPVEAPQSDAQPSGGTYTQEQVDEAVREAVREARQEANRALEQFKEMANARAVEYAETNGLCSEFERCMEDIGLMGRREWREANPQEFRVTFTVSVNVEAADRDDAYELAREALSDGDFSHYDLEEIEEL